MFQLINKIRFLNFVINDKNNRGNPNSNFISLKITLENSKMVNKDNLCNSNYFEKSSICRLLFIFSYNRGFTVVVFKTFPFLKLPN